jgi:SAM-dependent methyltransferase
MDKAHVHEGNADQAAYWNGEAGQRWTDRQETLDTVLAPTLEVLLDRAAVAAGERVIDIGCGCGTSVLALAGRVGPSGRVLGLDISAPMLARARERAPAGAPVELVLADATLYAFAPGSGDVLFSRFGVMFFADPVLSFSNMRTALRPGGRLAFACWREPDRNPWMRLPVQEAARHAPPLPASGPDEPGPFAFAREERVRAILEAAGFSSVVLEAVDLTVDLATGRGFDAAVANAVEITPARRILEGQPPDVVAEAQAAIRSALAPYAAGDKVPLGASVWIATADNPG